MSAEPAQPRPRQVTLAASLVMAASGMLVLSVFERLGNLRSLETRDAIQRFLSEPPGSDLGLGTEAVIDLVRTVSMVAAGLATAAAILGFHVLKRNRAARVGLTVLALPLFLCGLVTGGFLASVVAASVAMLWLAPARLWFSGRARPAEPARTHPTGPPPQVRPTPPPPAPSQPGTTGPPPWPAYGGPPPLPPLPPQPPPRPAGVVVACAITWVCCAFTVLMAGLLAAVLVADADGLFAELHRQNPTFADEGISDGTLAATTWASAGLCLLWALVSSGLAVLAFRRSRWAVIGLAVSAGLVAVLCLAGALVSPVLVVPGLLAAVVVALMLQPRVLRWTEIRVGDPAKGPPRDRRA